MHQTAGQTGSPLLSISDDVQERSHNDYALQQLHDMDTMNDQDENGNRCRLSLISKQPCVRPRPDEVESRLPSEISYSDQCHHQHA